MTTTPRPGVSNPATDAWMRLARAAAVTMVVWAVITHLTARVIIPPVLVIGLVFAAFVPFLRHGRRKVALGMAVFAALALVGNLPGLVDELTHLDSAPAFVLTLLSVIGAVLAIVAGIATFGSTTPPPTQRIVAVAAAVFVVLAVTSIAISVATDSDVPLSGDAEIVAEKVVFLPGDVTVAAGDAGIWVDNRDGIRHTLTIESAGVDLEIPALKARRADLDLAAGTYEFVCTVPGHENKKGTLTVTS